jgi:hypothetical protein
MRRCWVALLIILATAGASATRASDEGGGMLTAGEVASWCEPYRTAFINGNSVSAQNNLTTQTCFGAFLAIQQLATTRLLGASRGALRLCLPPTSTTVELVKVFIRYAVTHPEVDHTKFTDVALASLWAAFPCPPTAAK